MSIFDENARDDAENARDALKAKVAASMLEIQASVDELASYAGADQSTRRQCLDIIADELHDLVWDRETELTDLINDLTDQIERSDAPYRAQVA